MVLKVDAVVDEKPLVTKSVDNIVPSPPYLAGCTILGNGQVVPIFIPEYFSQLLTDKDKALESSRDITPVEKETYTGGKPSIMVIDDSVAVRRTLDRLLTQMGYEVTKCRDGKEAWNTLQNTNQNFDLAICDLEMPGFDGYKLLQLIRVTDTWKDLPVIILTSRDNELHRGKAFDMGANDYLTKPFNPVTVIEKVEALIAR